MAIATAVERGGFVYIYDEKGGQIRSFPSGHQSGDGLKGYTASTVSIRKGDFIYTYNEKGNQISAIPAR